MKIFITARFGGTISKEDEKVIGGLTDEQIIKISKEKIESELSGEVGCDIAEHIKTEIIRD